MRDAGVRTSNVCLIAPATFGGFETLASDRRERAGALAVHPPLGILSLAAVLAGHGIRVRLLDLNRLAVRLADAGETGPGAFFDTAAAELGRIDAGVFGLGSIAPSYPLTIRLAREIKRAHPSSTVVLGGPQASATDVQTIRAFPFIDFVVRGEAEETLPALLEALENPDEVTAVPGITFRRNCDPIRNPDPPATPDLERIPMAAYHLWPDLSKLPTVPLELGRGCPYDCTFCSTSRFFRRRYRFKAPKIAIAQMRTLRERFGVSSFDLMHDALTANRAKALEFCRELERSGERFEWSCSTRTDCVDEELLSLMAAVGCKAVFFGVESGSPDVQWAIGKHLDIAEALEAVRAVNRLGMQATVSVITGFPGESRQDVRATTDFLLDCARLDGVTPQFHLLAPLAGTAIEESYRGLLVWDEEAVSDMADESWRQDPDARALILDHPGIFPNFYAVPTGGLERAWLNRMRQFVLFGLDRLRWLTVALHRHCGILELFDRFSDWRTVRRPNGIGMSGDYFASSDFLCDLVEFAEMVFAGDCDGGALAITVLCQHQRAINAALNGPIIAASAVSDGSGTDDIRAVPRIRPGVTLTHLDADYDYVVECLRRARPLDNVPRQSVTFAARRTGDRDVAVMRLAPLAAALISHCDGTKTVAEIASIFPRLQDGLDRFPAEPACLFAVNDLARQGLLVFAAAPSTE